MIKKGRDGKRSGVCRAPTVAKKEVVGFEETPSSSELKSLALVSLASGVAGSSSELQARICPPSSISSQQSTTLSWMLPSAIRNATTPSVMSSFHVFLMASHYSSRNTLLYSSFLSVRNAWVGG